MDNFELMESLWSSADSIVYSARSKSPSLPVYLKVCTCAGQLHTETAIRSALHTVRAKKYPSPLLAIVAAGSLQQCALAFVWQNTAAIDPAMLSDADVHLPPLDSEYRDKKVKFTNPFTGTTVQEVFSECAAKRVIVKTSIHEQIAGLCAPLREALALANCDHENVCAFMDFRVGVNDDGKLRVSIVMESAGQDLTESLSKRRKSSQPYLEMELLEILREITAGLLHAHTLVKPSQGIVHLNLEPSSVMSQANNYKIASFGHACIHGFGSVASNTESVYCSPEATLSFPCDVYSLGATALHLATLKTPGRRNSPVSPFAREIKNLQYSDHLKSLLLRLTNTDPSGRPSLQETAAEVAAVLQASAAEWTLAQAKEISRRANLSYKAGDFADAQEMFASAEMKFSRSSPSDEGVPINLRLWGDCYRAKNNTAKAKEKYEAASAFYSQHSPTTPEALANITQLAAGFQAIGSWQEASRLYEAAHSAYTAQFPTHKDQAVNLQKWGEHCYQLHNFTEAIQHFEAAEQLYLSWKDTTIDRAENLMRWGDCCRELSGKAQAELIYLQAASIYALQSRTPTVHLRTAVLCHKMEDHKKAARQCQLAYQQLTQQDSTGLLMAKVLTKWADFSRHSRDYREACENYTKASALCTRYFPKDRATAKNHQHFGECLLESIDEVNAIKQFELADDIYSALSPTSIAGVHRKVNIADCYRRIGELDKATAKYAAAELLCAEYFSTLKDFPDVLCKAGDCYRDMKRLHDAVEKYSAAADISARYFPTDASTADILRAWGDCCCDMGLRDLAIDKYKAAEAIYAACSPPSFNAAENLFRWGCCYQQTGALDAAVAKFAAAAAIYAQHAPSLESADNHYICGCCYKEMGKDTQAMAEFEAAEAIYALSFPPDDYAARTLCGLADCNAKLGRLAVAAVKRRAASAIYARFFPTRSERAVNEYLLGELYRALAQHRAAVDVLEVADSLYSLHFPADVLGPRCKSSLADSYREVKDWGKADNKFRSAATAFAQVSPSDSYAGIHMLRWALSYTYQRKFAKADEMHAAAAAFYSQLDPTDIHAAYNLSKWGLLLLKKKDYSKAAEKVAAAHSVISVHYLELAADNLRTWAEICCELGDIEAAQQKNAAADKACLAFPSSLPTTLASLANAYARCDASTVEKCEAADAVNLQHFPTSVYTAHGLSDCGACYCAASRFEPALAKFAAAEEIYARHYPTHCARGENLQRWRKCCDRSGNQSSAAEKAEHAEEFYSRYFPVLRDRAINMMKWALALSNLNKHTAADAKFEAANQINERFYPMEEHTVQNLFYWGAFLKRLSRNSDSQSKFQQAKDICELAGYKELYEINSGLLRN